MANEPSDYDRGVTAGAIETRLAGHDKHFETINGSLARVADELHGMKLTLQRLADQAVSRDATALTTASALKDAEQARRDTAEQKWKPWQKTLAVLGGVAVVVGAVVAVLTLK